MKKLVFLLFLLLLYAFPALAAESPEAALEIGSTFIFGSFEQDGNTANGTEPIEWVVLKTDGDKALLLSKQILTCLPFHTVKENTSYENSYIRSWLNNEFINTAFNTAEQNAIVTSLASNTAEQGNSAWTAMEWSDTQERVFLMSYQEAETYLSNKVSRQCSATEYAKRQGALTLILPNLDYWLRSWGNAESTACLINFSGDYTSAAVTDKKGIRPMMWFDMNASQEEFRTTLYQNACALRDEERWKEAISAFDALGSYSDSLFQSTICKMADSSTLYAGFYYTFGQYEQDNNTENGNEPIEWLILENDGESVLLMSRYVLDCQPFATDTAHTDWMDSSIRTWLNSTFLENAFTEAERAALLKTQVSNGSTHQHPEWTKNSWSDTSDFAFLPSYTETEKRLTAEQRKGTVTEYARAQGAALPLVPNADYWLRSSGKDNHSAGMVNLLGDYVSQRATDKKGIRPLIRLSLKADENTFAQTQYTTACALQEAGAYLDAVAVFETIGNYRDSVLHIHQCHYSVAEIEEAAGNLDKAMEWYTLLGTYSDSYDRLGICRYTKAVALQNAGDYTNAMKEFAALGNYQDSIQRMTQCMKSLGIRIRYMTPNTVNTGLDNGYSKSNPLSGNDPHFGWQLGRFFISDFTRITNTPDEGLVFILTADEGFGNGDKLTLWYEIQQDIDQLDGKANLSIADDVNGYDEHFGIKKTDFGRGTLVIRITDYQNEQKELIIYTDYLAATTSHGAITKANLSEEGDYEVALNYEIVNDGVIDIYHNYRESFKFAVRSGNCIVYPHDLKTHELLVNSSLAPNGFYLNLAESRYLDINVKRYVLNTGATGLTEDILFNRAAKEGDRYTREGVYVIDVYNKYTNESTTKTIFVGSEAALQKYIAGGFVLP